VQSPLLERKTDMTHAREPNGSRVLAGTLNPQLAPLVTVCADAQLVNAAQLLSIRELPLQAKNDALQQTADAYFLVHQYRGTYAGALYSVARAKDVVDRVATFLAG